jgi:hypothetical protein
MRALFFAFLLGHAAVHAVMWTLPFTDATREMPFDPAHSWLLGDQRILAVVLAGMATASYLAAGAGWLAQAAWWPATMVGASALSLALMVVFFAPWWLVGMVVSGALAVYGAQALP